MVNPIQYHGIIPTHLTYVRYHKCHYESTMPMLLSVCREMHAKLQKDMAGVYLETRYDITLFSNWDKVYVRVWIAHKKACIFKTFDMTVSLAHAAYLDASLKHAVWWLGLVTTDLRRFEDQTCVCPISREPPTINPYILKFERTFDSSKQIYKYIY